MTSVFWDAHEIIFIEKGKTIKGVNYAILKSLNEAVALGEKVSFQDNAPIYMRNRGC